MGQTVSHGIKQTLEINRRKGLHVMPILSCKANPNMMSHCIMALFQSLNDAFSAWPPDDKSFNENSNHLRWIGVHDPHELLYKKYLLAAEAAQFLQPVVVPAGVC